MIRIMSKVHPNEVTNTPAENIQTEDVSQPLKEYCFSSFLGSTTCELRHFASATPAQPISFLLWEHSSARLADTEVSIYRRLHTLAPGSHVVVFMENGIPAPEKFEVQRIANDYLRGITEVEQGGATEGDQVVMETLAILRRVREKLNLDLELRFIDTEDPDLCMAGARRIAERDRAAKALNSCKYLSYDDVRKLAATPADFVKHMEVHIADLIQTQASAICAERNRFMAEQINSALRELPASSTSLVMIGALHAGVPFEFMKNREVWWEHVCLPQFFLEKISPSYRRSYQGAGWEIGAMKVLTGVAPTTDELTEYTFEWLVAEAMHDFSRLASELFAKNESFLKEPQVIRFLARAVCAMGTLEEKKECLGAFAREFYATIGVPAAREDFRFIMWKQAGKWLEGHLGIELVDFSDFPRIFRQILSTYFLDCYESAFGHAE